MPRGLNRPLSLVRSTTVHLLHSPFVSTRISHHKSSPSGVLLFEFLWGLIVWYFTFDSAFIRVWVCWWWMVGACCKWCMCCMCICMQKLRRTRSLHNLRETPTILVPTAPVNSWNMTNPQEIMWIMFAVSWTVLQYTSMLHFILCRLAIHEMHFHHSAWLRCSFSWIWLLSVLTC